MDMIFRVVVIIMLVATSASSLMSKHCFMCRWHSTSTHTKRSDGSVSSLSATAQSSQRMKQTERPYIEDVLDTYSSIPNITVLALGSSYWTPPAAVVSSVLAAGDSQVMHKYGNILGLPQLRNQVTDFLTAKGLDMSSGLEVAITAGANQAFMNTALCLVDSGDDVIVIAPYYFPHKSALQMCNAAVHVCPFDAATLGPQWEVLEQQMSSLKPKMVVLTTPNNPSGYVWKPEEMNRLQQLCKIHGSWLVVDQTYHEFLFDGSRHTYPCTSSSSSISSYSNGVSGSDSSGSSSSSDGGSDSGGGGSNGSSFSSTSSSSDSSSGECRVVQLFSFSKIFGMPGWRVGYAVYPKQLSESMRKVQDTIPTHTCMLSQQLALDCLRMLSPESNSNNNSDNSDNNSSSNNSNSRSGSDDWMQQTVDTLAAVREELWAVLAPLGTVKSTGAFYFLVPLPAQVSEEEAVDILARQYGVLLMHGSPFGAPGHLRLSYGSIPPAQVRAAIEKLKNGFQHLMNLSQERTL